jgi:serine phosphatase RsbU (regulator of sigma subunit)
MSRLAILFTIVAIAGVSLLIRHATGGSPVQGRPSLQILALVFGVAFYAAILGIVARRSNDARRLLPTWVWAVSVVIEAGFPTAAISTLLRGGQVTPREALASPAMLMYSVVILLSILRMRPWLCFMSGAVSAACHTGLILHAARVGHAGFGPSAYPYYLSYPVNLLLTGIAAALVASQVRRYFESSLREARARRSLDRVNDELAIARSIQQRLLPKQPPSVTGFDIAGWNRPADETGGDYYDWQSLPDGRVAVVIADVSGHGLGPALLMAVCRAYARACVPTGAALAAALGRVNKLLCTDVGDGRFVTLAAVVLDGTTGECEMISAGHGPIILHRKENGVDVLGANGIPLGISEDEEYGAPVRFRFEEGDSLLLITDGFVEWARAGDGECFGTKRLAAFVGASGGAGAAELIEKIEAEVRRFAGGAPQGDDMTAVAIKRIGSPRIS